MIKLKIGDNYLITTHKDNKMSDFIIYTMSCFKAHNKLLIGLDLLHKQMDFSDYLKAIREEQPRELYVLIDIIPSDDTPMYQWVPFVKEKLFHFSSQLKEMLPNLEPKVIKISKEKETREFKIGRSIYDSLKMDKKSILHHIDKLDEYKMFSGRYKAIPNEIKVIGENIKQMSKDKKICDRTITLKDLEYLDMIQEARLEHDSLVIKIKPLPIYPSEPLGKVITKGCFNDNKYLARAAEYLYKGCHFGMVGTEIIIHPDFRPEFIQTLDHTWDDMFQYNNWSTVGYLHFGKNHLCGGEFNDVIAHTAEHGLEYYFMCLKQYITTANMRDMAGQRVWWYPIYDNDNKLVYCAGLDVLRDWCMRRVDDATRRELESMTWEQFLDWKKKHNVSFGNAEINQWHSGHIRTQSNKEDEFLQYCKEKRPELYEELLEKGAM